MTLDECRIELRSIINELRDIESGIRCDFYGIGEQLCADCIDKIAEKYERHVLEKLNNVDYNKLAEWILDKN